MSITNAANRVLWATSCLLACLVVGAVHEFASVQAAEPDQSTPVNGRGPGKPEKIHPKWTLPEVDGWKHNQLKKVSTSRSDLTVNYQTDTILASIFFYDAGFEQIPSDLKSKIVQGHFRQVVGDIQTAVKLGVYKSASKVTEGESSLGSDEDAIKCLYGKYVIVRPELKCSSTIHLAVHRDHFVKVRCTWPAGDDVNAEKKIDRLLSALGKMLKDL